jgi:hypothetical protein
VDNSAVASQPVSLDLQVAGVGDFNGDGKSDVLFELLDGTLQTWVGAADGSILSPTEKLWQDAIANVGELVDEVASHIVPPSPSTGSSGPPPLEGFNAIFGPSFPTANEMDPGGTLGLFEDDREFTLRFFEETGFSVTFNADSFGSMTQLDPSGDSFLINVNGIDLIGDWHSGSPPASEPPADAIVITGQRDASGNTIPTGFYLFDPTANGFNFHDGHGGGGATASPLNTVLAHSTVVTVGHHNIYMPKNMTADEQAAANAFIAAVQEIDLSIATIPSNAQLTVTETWTDSSGQSHTLPVTVTPGDLEADWANTSFGLFTDADYATLNGPGTNGTGRGSSDIGFDPNMTGNIIAGFSIGEMTPEGPTGLEGYLQSNGEVAMEYLALHEVAHDTLAGFIMNLDTPDKNFNDFTPGSSNYANENFANTIALATLEALGVNLGPYYAATGTTTVQGGWQSANAWTVNNP